MKLHSHEAKRRAAALYGSGLSCRETASRLKDEIGTEISPQTVARWMCELGKSRPVGDRRTFELPVEAIRLYESGLTLHQVAEVFGVSATTIRKRLGEMRIEVRPRSIRYPPLADKAWLEDEYQVSGRSAKEIAQYVGCSVLTVHYHLRRHGIPRKRRWSINRSKYGRGLG